MHLGGTTRREALPCHCVRCSTQTLCAGFCLPSFDDSTRRGQPPTWLQCSDKAPRGGHFSRHRGPDGATADMLQMLPDLCVGDRLDARDVAATVAAAALKHSSCPSACPLLGTAPGARGNPRCCSTRTTLRVVHVPPCGPVQASLRAVWDVRLDARHHPPALPAAALRHSAHPSACPLLGTAPGA